MAQSKIKIYTDRRGTQLFSGELSSKPVDIGESVTKTLYFGNTGDKNIMVEVLTNHPEIQLRGETTFNISPEDMIPLTLIWTPRPEFEDIPFSTPLNWVERFIVG